MSTTEYPEHIRRKGDALLTVVNYALAWTIAALYVIGYLEFQIAVLSYLALLLYGQLTRSDE